MDGLARQADRKVHVVADRHPVHRCRAVTAWLAGNSERVQLHLMPAYSPELNPDELLNADIKRHVHATRARSADDLTHETRRFLHRRQRQPTSSAATSMPDTSATPSSRQHNSSASISLPSSDPNDPGYRRLRYIRYADDHLLGFTGPKAEPSRSNSAWQTSFVTNSSWNSPRTRR
ncbi:transposase [Streptomyces netropsis]|uniref:transposase n=1 Tax=Streptomyces netropsis TaxID=55404 RepID=UPI0037B79678